jgi:type II secretory pathway pseudopilin PulG
MALGAIALKVGGVAGEDPFGPFVLLLGFVCLGIAVLQIVCGLGLLKLAPHGRTIMIVLSVLGLLAFPFGTIVAILVLIYMFRPGVKILFSGQPAASLAPEQAAQVRAASLSPLVIVIVVILLGFGGVLMFGTMAAIAVPGLMRARQSGNEVSAIASLRAITSAQMTYAASCGGGGFAGSLEDLAKPPRGGAAFISPELATTNIVKSGYRISVQPAFDASLVLPRADTCNGSTSDAVSAFFATAEPDDPGSSGRRYFAVDAAGAVYQSTRPISNPLRGSPDVTPVQ